MLRACLDLVSQTRAEERVLSPEDFVLLLSIGASYRLLQAADFHVRFIAISFVALQQAALTFPILPVRPRLNTHHYRFDLRKLDSPSVTIFLTLARTRRALGICFLPLSHCSFSSSISPNTRAATRFAIRILCDRIAAILGSTGDHSDCFSTNTFRETAEILQHCRGSFQACSLLHKLVDYWPPANHFGCCGREVGFIDNG